MTKPSPGTPSMHLFDEAATAFERQPRRASSGMAPKALMASMRQRPAVAPHQVGELAGIGLRMPEVVSQWIVKTWVIAASSFRSAPTAGEIGRRVLGRSCTVVAAAGDVADLRRAVAVGAVDQQEHLAAGGTKVVSMASTAKVPEPCIGTVT